MNSERKFYPIQYSLDVSLKQMEVYAWGQLGEEYFSLSRDFFFSIFRFPAAYKVFLTRRCFNFMFVFWELCKSDLSTDKQKIEATLYTNSALLANAPEIAAFYSRFGFVPSILIVDDILIHGNTMNRLIDQLIDEVYRCLTVQDKGSLRKQVEQSILDSLTIRTLVQNDKPLLLRRQYQKCLQSDPTQKDVWPPKRWHELSSRISQLVSGNIFPNTNFVLTLSDHMLAPDCSAVYMLEKAAQQEGFSPVRWAKRNIRDVWCRTLKDASGSIKAIYTIRTTQCSVNRTFCATPFVFLANADKSLTDKLILALLSHGITNAQNAFAIWSASSNTCAKIACMVLSHNLLLLLQQSTGTKCVDSGFLDFAKIQRSFSVNGHAETIRFVDELCALESPILSWGEMDSLILSVTQSSEPLITYKEKSDSACTHDEVETLLEDVLAIQSEEHEQNAYFQYSGQYNSHKNEENLDVRLLFATMQQICPRFQNAGERELCFASASVLRAMDLNMMDTVASERNGEIVYQYRVGEQAQFIRPQRYTKHFSVLVRMEQDCHFRVQNILDKIGEFYKDDGESTVRELQNFVRTLYASGQRLSDWDINWINRMPWNQSADDAPANEHEQTRAMLNQVSKLLAELERYNSQK